MAAGRVLRYETPLLSFHYLRLKLNIIRFSFVLMTRMQARELYVFTSTRMSTIYYVL